MASLQKNTGTRVERKASNPPSPLPEKIALVLQESRWLALIVLAAFLGLALWGYNRADPGWSHAMQVAVVDPFVDFFRRYGVPLMLAILAFILLFKVPEQATIGGIMSPFYIDMGFTKSQVGSITKLWGVWVGIVGVFLGGAMVARWGAWKSLGVMIVVCGACNLLYLLLIPNQGNLWVLTAVISAENLTLGMLGPPTVAFLSSLVNREHTATQYALLSSLVNLPGKVLGFFAGGIAMATGYGMYFVITVLALLPAMLVYALLTPQLRSRGES